MDLKPITLTGKYIRLEPPEERHADDIALSGDTTMFTYTYGPKTWTPPDIWAYMQHYVSLDNALPFVMIDLESEKAIGFSGLINAYFYHNRIELGSTWVNPPYQGTLVNKESKYLMLRHAFEDQGVNRVEFKLDPRNQRSANALRSIGAVEEGLLRDHMVLMDGTIRDSQFFSIIAAEWPQVKQHLAEKLRY